MHVKVLCIDSLCCIHITQLDVEERKGERRVSQSLLLLQYYIQQLVPSVCTPGPLKKAHSTPGAGGVLHTYVISSSDFPQISNHVTAPAGCKRHMFKIIEQDRLAVCRPSC